MFSFSEFLEERAPATRSARPAANKRTAAPKEDSNLNDDKGKLAELHLAHHLGKHLAKKGQRYIPSHYREEERMDKRKGKIVGGTPEQVEARILARRGKDMHNAVDQHSSQTAEALIDHLIKTGRISHRNDIQGVHWTSQADSEKSAGDHERLTGVKDVNQKGDLIISARGKDGKTTYIPVSAKYGSENKPNYANWGLDRLGNESGMESHPETGKNRLQQIKDEHDKELEDKLGHVYGEKAGAFSAEQKHALFKADRDLRDQKLKEDRDFAAGKITKKTRWTAAQLRRIDNAEQAYGISQKHRRRMASALADTFNQRAAADGNDSHMRGFISKSISDSTVLPTVIAHSRTKANDPHGDAESRVYDQADVAPSVLNKYEGIHAKVATNDNDEDGGAISLHFYGKNKKTGAIENVATQSIKAGSGPYKGANGTFKIQHAKEEDRDPQVNAPDNRIVQDKETGEQSSLEPTVPDNATVWGPKKMLSQFRKQRMPSNFANFIRSKNQQSAPEQQTQVQQPVQQQGGFAAMPAPKVSRPPRVDRPIDPHEHKQYVSGEHGGMSFRGPGDM